VRRKVTLCGQNVVFLEAASCSARRFVRTLKKLHNYLMLKYTKHYKVT